MKKMFQTNDGKLFEDYDAACAWESEAADIALDKSGLRPFIDGYEDEESKRWAKFVIPDLIDWCASNNLVLTLGTPVQLNKVSESPDISPVPYEPPTATEGCVRR